MLNLTRLHLGIAHESQFQGLGISVGLIIITMLTRSALAQQVYTTVPVRPAPTEHKILPPPEYDYVYEGDLTIVMVKTVEELLILCNVESSNTLACSIRHTIQKAA